jgi:hypothetical protein
MFEDDAANSAFETMSSGLNMLSYDLACLSAACFSLSACACAANSRFDAFSVARSPASYASRDSAGDSVQH